MDVWAAKGGSFFTAFDTIYIQKLVTMDDDDEQFMLDQMRKYLPAMEDFRATRSMWRNRIPEFAGLSMEAQHSAIRPYEKILFGVHARPQYMPFVKSEDEFVDFCDALVIAWRLLPDAWVGLQMMIDYLAESTRNEDLAELGDTTLMVLKEIAKKKHWPNNPMLGPMMFSGQAKAILARVTRDAPFHEATTVPSVRAINMVPGVGQPPRRPQGFNLDRRKLCANPACVEVEGEEKFKCCSRCKVKRYCSKACQTTHWRAGHKKECKAKTQK